MLGRFAAMGIISLARAAVAVIVLAGLVVVTGGAPAAAAGTMLQGACASCNASAPAVMVDPASYKLWPSGSRTFVNAQWTPNGGEASFDVRNFSDAPTPALTATVEVSDHDPASQVPLDHTVHTYPIPALAPGASSTVHVPLDPTQCDIWVSVALGLGDPTIMRTGNPATC